MSIHGFRGSSRSGTWNKGKEKPKLITTCVKYSE